MIRSSILLLWLAGFANAQNREGVYLDRFTYNDQDIAIEHDLNNDGINDHTSFDYAPDHWGEITCNEGSALDECVGYTDKWETGRAWGVTKNYCKSCPANGNHNCGRHHQSPVNLQRVVGMDFDPDSPDYSALANECIDLHWMKYEDSFCSLDQLEDADAFTIERHALRIAQPISVFDNFAEDLDGVPDGVKLECRQPGRGSRFGRIDYSKGFSHWWHLSHIDIHTPSEHWQDGVQYDGEIQLKHFYSIPWYETGTDVNNEMGTVSVFLQAYEDAAPYRYLDKVICQWRRKEYEVRTECGLPLEAPPYPGCFPYDNERRKLRRRDGENEDGSDAPKFKRHPKGFRTVHDVILHNELNSNNPNHTNVHIHMGEENWEPADDTIDWDSFIADHSQMMNDEEQLYKEMMAMENGDSDTVFNATLHEEYRRKLINYDEIPWFNYWPMLGVRTEYYFRYSGGDTIPPCYGNFDGGSRRGTNHWRVLKDPIRIHPRQLTELRRLIAERIAPSDDPVMACQPDTAAKVTRDPEDPKKILDVNTARPLQEWDRVHFKTFCECKDWPSKWPEDRKWCEIEDLQTRLFDKKYNFDAYE